MKTIFALFVAHAVTRDGGCTVAFAPSSTPKARSTLPMSRSGYSSVGGGRDDSWDRAPLDRGWSRRGGSSSYDGYDDRDYDRRWSDRRGGRGGRAMYDSYDMGYDGYGRGGYLGGDDYFYNGSYNGPIFGNSNYYNDPYSRGSISEDFRQASSRGDRYQRRETMRGRGGRMQDYYTPREREMMNPGVRYGWQQTYDRNRGNVRNSGSSENFRRGSALARMQDVYTPREREELQMRDNSALSRGFYGDDIWDERDAFYGYEGGRGRGRMDFGRDNSMFDSDRRRSDYRYRDGYDDRDYDEYDDFDDYIDVGRSSEYDRYGPGRRGRGTSDRIRDGWDSFKNIFN